MKNQSLPQKTNQVVILKKLMKNKNENSLKLGKNDDMKNQINKQNEM